DGAARRPLYRIPAAATRPVRTAWRRIQPGGANAPTASVHSSPCAAPPFVTAGAGAPVRLRLREGCNSLVTRAPPNVFGQNGASGGSYRSIRTFHPRNASIGGSFLGRRY